jgi:predicted transposase/invertase (TIGR01784 family)
VKTDSIFYRLFQDFPETFFDLLGFPADEADAYRFTSREIKQLAFRIDGLFCPESGETGKSFYLVEVQFQIDRAFYYRLFAELFLLLKQYQPAHPWEIVVIYPTRSIEREETTHFAEMLSSSRVHRFYLDELTEGDSLGIGLLQLIIEREEDAGRKALQLVQKGRERLTDETARNNWIDLIETILVYKLPQKSREEIEAMFGLSELKQTKVYQEAQLEAKLASIPRMLDYGLSLEVIAGSLDLSIDLVREEARKYRSNPEGDS